jgi:hypothetical protein
MFITRQSSPSGSRGSVGSISAGSPPSTCGGPLTELHGCRARRSTAALLRRLTAIHPAVDAAYGTPLKHMNAVVEIAAQ